MGCSAIGTIVEGCYGEGFTAFLEGVVTVTLSIHKLKYSIHVAVEESAILFHQNPPFQSSHTVKSIDTLFIGERICQRGGSLANYFISYS
jgi:hypothetical protein